MLKPSLVLTALMLIATPAFAADSLGRVTKVNRPVLNTFDDQGVPAGQIKSGDVKLPAPIVGFGKGQSVGIKVKDKVVFLRGLDVVTDGVNAKCDAVQTASRAKGSAYAASNMGLGSPCIKQ